MKKTVINILVIFTIVACFFNPVFTTRAWAEDDNNISRTMKHSVCFLLEKPYMWIDGEVKDIDSSGAICPFIINGRTLLPLRALVEALEGNVEWVESEKKINITLKEKSLNLWIGKKAAKVNNIEKTLDVPPTIINGRTMVPVRFIGENLDYEIGWNPDLKKITVIAKENFSDKVSDMNTIVDFADENLERVIRENINKPEGMIRVEDVIGITSLSAHGRGIKSLYGIEYLAALETLNLSNNEISDLTPLMHLSNLTELDINLNDVSDIWPVCLLNKLKRFDAMFNHIRVARPLLELTALDIANLTDNPIEDGAMIKNRNGWFYDLREDERLSGVSEEDKRYIFGEALSVVVDRIIDSGKHDKFDKFIVCTRYVTPELLPVSEGIEFNPLSYREILEQSAEQEKGIMFLAVSDFSGDSEEVVIKFSYVEAMAYKPTLIRGYEGFEGKATKINGKWQVVTDGTWVQ